MTVHTSVLTHTHTHTAFVFCQFINTVFLSNAFLCYLQKLDKCDNEEVSTQIHVFIESKMQDADELGHRYENIQFEMEYPFHDGLLLNCYSPFSNLLLIISNRISLWEQCNTN